MTDATGAGQPRTTRGNPLNRWWVRGAIALVAFTELLMLPFTFMQGWWVAAMIPALVVGMLGLTWLFDRGVRWVDGGDR